MMSIKLDADKCIASVEGEFEIEHNMDFIIEKISSKIRFRRICYKFDEV